MKCLDILSSYFSFMVQTKGSLPITFNYRYFFDSLKIIIQNSFSYCTSKALTIIYTFFNNFSIEFRQNLIKYLLGKAFFQLFLHWSFSVRTVFYHILTIKLDDEILSNNQWLMHEINTKFKNNMEIIRQAAEAKKNMER